MDTTGNGTSIMELLVVLAFLIGFAVAYWKIFEKAGRPGWAALVPIYSAVVLLEIIGRPTWWLILLFVPCVNFVIFFIILIDLAKSFGKEWWFAFLFLIAFIGFFILGFGKDEYQGPAAPQKEAA